MKALGSQIMAFWEAFGDIFSGDWGLEESAAQDGTMDLNAGEKYDVDDMLGFLVWHGRDEPPSAIEIKGKKVLVRDEVMSVTPFFRAWTSTDVVLVVHCKDAAQAEEVRAALAHLKVKVSR